MCLGGGGSTTYYVPQQTSSSSSSSSETKQEVAAPTYADASVTKATATTRNKTAALAGRDIRTSARGLKSFSNNSDNEKRDMLGG